MLKKTLYFSNKCSITTKYGQLIIKSEVRDASIPIEDIGFIVLENQESYISIPALNKLIAHNVSTIFCNEKHLPTSMLLNLNGHHIQQTIFKDQINASEPLKKQLWQQTIKKKIYNQAELLKRIGKKDLPLRNMISKVLSGDTTNKEAQAASYYWKQLFNIDFSRHRFGNYPNNFLNYGYTILRASVARALAGSGLLSTLGIHHHNKYNSFCLADDIMEPYRPLVDYVILKIMNESSETTLNKNIKSSILELLTETVYFEDSKSTLMVGLSKTTSSLQHCFTGQLKKIIYPNLWN